MKPGFDILVQRIADRYGALAMLPPVKGEERGSVKVNVRYGGDASQLSDIVRATLKFPMGHGAVQNMYDAVEALINMPELRSARASVTHFSDRYQSPMDGGYMDLLCLIKLNNYVCELQFNIDKVLDIKEGSGHKKYELERKVNDELIHAAMKKNRNGLMKALNESAKPNATRDTYSLTTLHYAAHHGDIEMVEALLSSSADVFAQDNEGRLPVHRAVLLGHVAVVEALLKSMESSKVCKLRHNLTT